MRFSFSGRNTLLSYTIECIEASKSIENHYRFQLKYNFSLTNTYPYRYLDKEDDTYRGIDGGKENDVQVKSL
ncbi:hypothetical protein TAMA11512_18090 [Selenomonas sp. TAMA-11512]|nr:hypothetical protein TAMA11512_18090 [Selenomonas sp. TAMA-11512]